MHCKYFKGCYYALNYWNKCEAIVDMFPAVTSVDTCVDGEEVEVGDDRDESCWRRKGRQRRTIPTSCPVRKQGFSSLK